jgi:hypothetical protein
MLQAGAVLPKRYIHIPAINQHLIQNLSVIIINLVYDQPSAKQ